MDLTAVIQAIGTVGFPILMCLLMHKSNNETIKTIADLTTVVQENTTVIKALWTKLEKE